MAGVHLAGPPQLVVAAGTDATGGHVRMATGPAGCRTCTPESVVGSRNAKNGGPAAQWKSEIFRKLVFSPIDVTRRQTLRLLVIVSAPDQWSGVIFLVSK